MHMFVALKRFLWPPTNSFATCSSFAESLVDTLLIERTSVSGHLPVEVLSPPPPLKKAMRSSAAAAAPRLANINGPLTLNLSEQLQVVEEEADEAGAIAGVAEDGGADDVADEYPTCSCASDKDNDAMEKNRIAHAMITGEP
uniref:Uncharacterized protein n=1 Tax=Oryza meridionalis TaxID=40149 RepID=A0A0E0EEI8_9ORYZ